jgi:hypothetical protein
MRRAEGQRPTVEDLDERQRRIWEMLPEEGRELYLETLPLIRPTPQSEKQVEAIRRRLETLADLERYARDERARLRTLLQRVESGRTVNILKELAAPAIPGVTLRFPARRPTDEQQLQPAHLASARRDGPRAASGSTDGAAKAQAQRRKEPEPAVDPGAPFGRDRSGQPYAPFGRRKDGTPALPRGGNAEEQIDNFIARVTAHPELTAADVARK